MSGAAGDQVLRARVVVRGVPHQLLWCSLLLWPCWSFQDTGRSSLAAAGGNAGWTHTDGSRCVCVSVCHR